jgi:hypothetical protein
MESSPANYLSPAIDEGPLSGDLDQKGPLR